MSTSTFAAPGFPGFGAKSVTFALTSTVTMPPGSYETARTFTSIRRPSTGAYVSENANRVAGLVSLNHAWAWICCVVGIVARSVKSFSPVDPVNANTPALQIAPFGQVFTQSWPSPTGARLPSLIRFTDQITFRVSPGRHRERSVAGARDHVRRAKRVRALVPPIRASHKFHGWPPTP